MSHFLWVAVRQETYNPAYSTLLRISIFSPTFLHNLRLLASIHHRPPRAGVCCHPQIYKVPVTATVPRAIQTHEQTETGDPEADNVARGPIPLDRKVLASRSGLPLHGVTRLVTIPGIMILSHATTSTVGLLRDARCYGTKRRGSLERWPAGDEQKHLFLVRQFLPSQKEGKMVDIHRCSK